ncbi:MAG: dihydroorotase [Candidatus Methanospirareceae archaeon]
MRDLVVAGRIASRDGVYEGEIGIDNGIIAEIKKQGVKGERRIEAKGCLIFPGFIDIHAHLREDDGHRWDHKEDFRTGTAAALHGGITTIVDMPNTPSPGVSLERIRRKKELAAKKGLIDVMFAGGVTTYNTEELTNMKREVVLYKIYLCETTGGLRIPKDFLLEAMSVIARTSKPVTIHCEDQGILDEIKKDLKGVNERNYSDIRPEEAEVSSVKFVVRLLQGKKLDLRVNVAHISTYGALKEIYDNEKCFCEVTPHHLFFSREDMLEKRAFLKMNPPLREENSRRLLLKALLSYKIDFLVSDHAPHTREEKERDFSEAPSGVPNLDTYGNFVAWLIKRGANPTLISRMCASNPASFLGLNDRGVIEIGKRADISILDMKKGVKITSENLYTKCGWSPFEGYEFPGSIRYVILKGEIRNEDGDVFQKF